MATTRHNLEAHGLLMFTPPPDVTIGSSAIKTLSR